jgi:hypothetical protein
MRKHIKALNELNDLVEVGKKSTRSRNSVVKAKNLLSQFPHYNPQSIHPSDESLLDSADWKFGIFAPKLKAIFTTIQDKSAYLLVNQPEALKISSNHSKTSKTHDI